MDGRRPWRSDKKVFHSVDEKRRASLGEHRLGDESEPEDGAHAGGAGWLAGRGQKAGLHSSDSNNTIRKTHKQWLMQMFLWVA